jgi:hypothetical protein
VIDRLWFEFDLDKNGYLDVSECQKLVSRLFSTNFDTSQFKQWFAQYDKDRSNTIEKREFSQFLLKIIK